MRPRLPEWFEDEAIENVELPGRASRLLELLNDHCEPVTTSEARELAAETDDDLDRSYQTVRYWITALIEAGALQAVGEDGNGATEYWGE